MLAGAGGITAALVIAELGAEAITGGGADAAAATGISGATATLFGSHAGHSFTEGGISHPHSGQIQ